MPNDTPGIGHNLSPVDALKANLKERHAKLENRILELAERKIPAVKTEADATKVTTFVGQCKAALKALDEAHKVEKEDALRVGQAVDKWRRDFRAEVEPQIAAALAALQPFMDAKHAAETKRLEEEAAERQRQLQAKLDAEAAERKAAEAAEAAAAAAEAEETRKAAEAAAAAAKATPKGDSRHVAEAAAAELAHRAEEARKNAEAAMAAAEQPVAKVTAAAEPIGDVRVRVAGPDNRALAKTVWTWGWVGEGPDKFDLNTVRNWMPPEAVSSAIDAAVRAGKRDLGPCVDIRETTKVVV